MSNPHHSTSYYQFTSGQVIPGNTDVIVESPVSLTVNGEVWLTFMCTPVDLDAMAVGFLYNEGLLQKAEELASVRICPSGDNVDVWLNHTVEKPERWRRTSGCTGGMTSVDEESQQSKPALLDGVILTPEQVFELTAQLIESQDLYRRSGGVHTSALCDGMTVRVIAEDIGRHNTLDKISGKCLLDGLQFSRRILLTTGRISSEMLQKSARIGASVVISRTSPSSLSIRLAETWGITLIGYSRRNRFNVYTHPERILPANTSERKLENQENLRHLSE